MLNETKNFTKLIKTTIDEIQDNLEKIEFQRELGKLFVDTSNKSKEGLE